MSDLLRRPGAGIGLACAAVLLLSLALGAWVHQLRAQAQRQSPVQGQMRQAADATAEGASELPALAGLVVRCEQAMLQGRCGVMKPDAAAAPESRVFIAGAGEVDAQVYAALRQQGEAMCGEVRRQCAEAWDGTACRIARSLYPAGPADPR